MDDVLRRLGIVEEAVGGLRTAVVELRVDVSAIKATLAATLPHLATTGDLRGVKGEMHALEARLIRWMVGSTIGGLSAAFALAKFIN